MANPIVEVSVTIYLEPISIKIEVDTSEDGEWDASKVKACARERAIDRYRHDEEKPEIDNVEAVITG